MKILFPDQQEAVDAVSAAFFKEKHSTVVLVGPTGSGKTVMGARMVAGLVKAGKRVLWLTHKRELVDGTNKTMIEFGLSPQIIDAASKMPKIEQPFYIAMSPTMRARLSASSVFESIIIKQVDFVFIDEAHRTDFCWFFDSGYFVGKKVLGLTATPIFTKPGFFMQDYYQKMIFNAKHHELAALTDMGRLCPITMVEPEGAEEAVAELEDDGAGGYKKASVERFRRKIGKAFRGVEKAIKEFASGRPTLVFCQDGLHAIETCVKLNDAGISAKYLLSSVQRKEAKDMNEQYYKRYSGPRNAIVSGFKTSHFDVLVNVDLLTTGFDFPRLFCAVIDRAAESLPLFLQIVGRLTRLHEEKQFAVLVDMTGASRKHGGIYAPRNWRFLPKPDKKKGTAPTKTCQWCGALNHTTAAVCRDCGRPFHKAGREFTEVEMFCLTSYYEQRGSVPAVSGLGEFEALELIRDANRHLPGWLYSQLAAKHGKEGLKDALVRYSLWKGKPYSDIFHHAIKSSRLARETLGVRLA